MILLLIYFLITKTTKTFNDSPAATTTVDISNEVDSLNKLNELIIINLNSILNDNLDHNPQLKLSMYNEVKKNYETAINRTKLISNEIGKLSIKVDTAVKKAKTDSTADATATADASQKKNIY